MKGRMVLAAAPIGKLRVGGRSRRKVGFCWWKRPVSGSLHRGLAAPVYDFALGIGDELVSYTVKKPRKSPTRYFVHSNNLFSVAATTNASGQVVEKYSYSAYGVQYLKNSTNSSLSKSAIGQSRGFTGYAFDIETGLYYARTRMYAPKAGRFIDRMPWFSLNGLIFQAWPLILLPESEMVPMLQVLREEAQGAYLQQRYSLYDYCFNSPGNFTEPFSRGGVRPPQRPPPPPRPPSGGGGSSGGTGGSSGGGGGSNNWPPPSNGPLAPPPVPPGWTSRPADNGRGTVYENPFNPGETIRVMEPTCRYPNGYWRRTNGSGQPLDPRTGRPGPREDTHIPMPPPPDPNTPTIGPPGPRDRPLDPPPGNNPNLWSH